MMWISKLELNLRDRAVRNDLRDCHELHRTLMRPFGETDEESARDALAVLYRVEQSRGSVQVLVQSSVGPNYAKLREGYCTVPPQVKERAPTLEQLKGGERFRFRLRANPTRSISGEPGADGLRGRGKRVEVRGEEASLEWMARKAEQHGFEMGGCRMNAGPPDPRVVSGKITGRRNGALITIATALFDGLLVVRDPVLFGQAISHGIGRGKSYGQGLLSIAMVAGE